MSLDWLTSWMSPSKQNTQDTQKQEHSGQQATSRSGAWGTGDFRQFWQDFGQQRPGAFDPYMDQGAYGQSRATEYLQPAAANMNAFQYGLQPGDANKWYNSNVQNVVDATQAQFARNNADQMAGESANAALRGAITGSGAATQRANTIRAQHTAQDPIVAKAYYDAQQQAQQTALAERQQQIGAAGAMPGFTNAASSAWGSLSNTGLGRYKAPMDQWAQMAGAWNPYIGASGADTSGTGWGNSSQNTQGWSRDNVSPLQAGSFLASMLPFSDERIKEDIAPIGKTLDGQTIYRFRYKDSPKVEIGLIAQRVAEDHPDAVGERDGLLTVDYDAATRDAAAIGAEHGGFAFGGGIPGFADGGASLPPWMTGGVQTPNSNPWDQSTTSPPLGGMPYQPQMPMTPTNAAPANPLSNPFAPTSPMPNNPMLSKPLGAPMGSPQMGGTGFMPPPTTMAPALATPQESSGLMTPPAPPPMSAAVMPQSPDSARGNYGPALGATPGLAGGMGKPVSMGGWAEGGVVGDRNGSGDFADKVHRAFRTFHKMRKEAANGGVIEDEQPARYDIGGGVGDPLGGESEFLVNESRNMPGPGENMPSAPLGQWNPITTPTPDLGGPPSDDRYWDVMQGRALGNPTGAQPAGDQYSFLDRLAKGTAELSRNTGQRTDKPQQGAPQGPGDIKNSSAEALARMMAGLQRQPPSPLDSPPVQGVTYDAGGRVGYARGGPEDSGEDSGGGILDSIWNRVSNYAKDPLKGTVYDAAAASNPTPWHNLVRAGMAGSPMAAGVTQNIADQRAADDLYTRLKGQLHLPGVGQTDKPSYEAQKEMGAINTPNGPVPTVHSRATATQELTAPYSALELRNRALKEDPALAARKIRLMQKLDRNEQLTQQDLDDLSMLHIPLPAFPGQPGAPGAKTSAAGSPSAPAPLSPSTAAGPAAAAAPPAAVPSGTPPPIPVSGTPGRTGGLPPAQPQDTPPRSPQALAANIRDGVLGAKDPSLAETNWKALMDDPNNAKMVQDYYRAQGVPMPDWMTAARGFVGGIGQAAPGQMPAQRQTPGSLVPQGGDVRSSVKQGREFAPAESAIRKPYGGADENKLKYQAILEPGIKDVLAHDPARAAAIKRAQLEEERDMKITGSQEAGKGMVMAMDGLRDSMVAAGPDVLWWASGPFLSNPGVRKWVSALGTTDSNVARGHDLGVEVSHQIDAVLNQLPQLGISKESTDSARENAKSALGEAFKARDLEKVFKVFHDATNMVLRAAYLRQEPPKKSYYPEEWIARGLGPKAAGYAPPNAPPELVRQMEAETAKRPGSDNVKDALALPDGFMTYQGREYFKAGKMMYPADTPVEKLPPEIQQQFEWQKRNRGWTDIFSPPKTPIDIGPQ